MCRVRIALARGPGQAGCRVQGNPGRRPKYLSEPVPLVQARAVKLAPTTIGALLEEKFTEDELKQVVAIVESPVYTKFQRMGEDMQRALVEKLIADMRPTVEPRIRALEETVGKRLGVTASGAPAAGPRRRRSRPSRRRSSHRAL